MEQNLLNLTSSCSQLTTTQPNSQITDEEIVAFSGESTLVNNVSVSTVNLTDTTNDPDQNIVEEENFNIFEEISKNSSMKWHDLQINLNNQYKLDVLNKTTELHLLKVLYQAEKEKVDELNSEIKQMKAEYEIRKVNVEKGQEMEKMLEDHLKRADDLIESKRFVLELLKENCRYSELKNAEAKKMEQSIQKEFDKAYRETKELLEDCPLARKCNAKKVQLQKSRTELAIIKQKIAEQERKNALIRNIKKKQTQLRIVKFAEIMLEYQEMLKIQQEIKILENKKKQKPENSPEFVQPTSAVTNVHKATMKKDSSKTQKIMNLPSLKPLELSYSNIFIRDKNVQSENAQKATLKRALDKENYGSLKKLALSENIAPSTSSNLITKNVPSKLINIPSLEAYKPTQMFKKLTEVNKKIAAPQNIKNKNIEKTNITNSSKSSLDNIHLSRFNNNETTIKPTLSKSSLKIPEPISQVQILIPDDSNLKQVLPEDKLVQAKNLHKNKSQDMMPQKINENKCASASTKLKPGEECSPYFSQMSNKVNQKEKSADNSMNGLPQTCKEKDKNVSDNLPKGINPPSFNINTQYSTNAFNGIENIEILSTPGSIMPTFTSDENAEMEEEIINGNEEFPVMPFGEQEYPMDPNALQQYYKNFPDDINAYLMNPAVPDVETGSQLSDQSNFSISLPNMNNEKPENQNQESAVSNTTSLFGTSNQPRQENAFTFNFNNKPESKGMHFSMFG